jgi:hypothetical protein
MEVEMVYFLVNVRNKAMQPTYTDFLNRFEAVIVHVLLLGIILYNAVIYANIECASFK